MKPFKMNSIAFKLLICMTMSLILVNHSNAFRVGPLFAPKTRDCNNDYSLDYVALALQWSPGVCATSNQDCERGDNVNNFTIHGLWPGRHTNRMEPNNCCFDRQFNETALAPIIDQLKIYWYGYFNKNEDAADKQFWQHEWTKHGTCSKNIDRLHGEFNYFSTTLNMFLNLPIIETLAKSGIVPDNTRAYKAKEIIEILKSLHQGKMVEVGCNFEHGHHPVPDLVGLNFCFGPTLEPVDCPVSKGRCSKDITFKKSVK